MAIKYIGEAGVKELASLVKSECAAQAEAAIVQATATDEEVTAMLDEVFGKA